MRHACLRGFLCLLCVVAAHTTERAQTSKPEFSVDPKSQHERLAALGKLWGAIKFFHPYLAYKAIDWDAALIRAIPSVKAARTPAEYRAAIAEMLEALGDPATRVESAESGESSSTTKPAAVEHEPTYFHHVDGHLVITAVDWARAMPGGGAATSAKQMQMMVELEKAKGVVLDSRFGPTSPSSVPWFYLITYINGSLAPLLQGTVPLGTERYRLHNGYPPQQGSTSGGYWSGLVTDTPNVIAGLSKDKKPLAVVIDDKTPDLAAIWSGVQAAGGRILRVGHAGTAARAGTRSMALADDVRVSLRVSEFVNPGGGSVFEPDLELTNEAGAGEAGIAAAIKLLASAAPTRTTGGAAPLVMRGQKDDPYSSMSFPSEEYRLLALFRYWNVINYFYPYKHLIDKPWPTVLSEFVPRFLENKTALEYETTVAEMVARMQDSHGGVRGFRSLNEHLGTFAPPVRLASAGGRLVVVEVTDPAAQTSGVAVGAEILAVDGEPVSKRIAALSGLRALSTPQAAYSFIYPSVLRGAKGSTVSVRVQTPDGTTREATLTRSASLGSVSGMLARKTPIHQVMPKGFGYIDLARLPLADAHKALDAVLKTPATIFDMRGYPNGTAWALAPRLGDKENVTAALFRRPLQRALEFAEDDLDSPVYAFAQKIPSPEGAIYRGKVVMLINEFAISQSEHTCMFFESATDVTFIGSPTNGANGDVTNLVLPGNLYVNFTGHDVRHADGRQLQRVGIQPHIKVEPTPKGVSEGRDEVLEAAIKYLDDTLKRPGTSKIR